MTLLCYNKGTKEKEMQTMATYTMTIYHFNEIKDRVPHADPKFFKQDGMTCVEVKMNEDIFNDVAKKKGWF